MSINLSESDPTTVIVDGKKISLDELVNSIGEIRAMEFLAQVLVPQATIDSGKTATTGSSSKKTKRSSTKKKSNTATSPQTTPLTKRKVDDLNEGQRFFRELIEPDYESELPPMREGFCDEILRMLFAFGATRLTDDRIVRYLHRKLHVFCVDVFLRPILYVAWTRARHAVIQNALNAKPFKPQLIRLRDSYMYQAFANHPSITKRLQELAYSREIVELAYRVNFDDSDAVALYERAVADKNDTSNVASIKRNDSTLDFEDVEDDDVNDNNNDVEEYDNDDEFDNNSDNSDNDDDDDDDDDDDEKDASDFVPKNINTKSTRSTRSRSNKKRKVTKNTSTVAMNDTMNIIDIIKREKIENANDNEEDSLIEEEEGGGGGGGEGKVEEQAANVDDSNQTTNIENNQTSSNIAVDPSSRRAKRLAFREQLTRSISSEHYEYYCYCARATLVSSYSRFRKWLAANPQKKNPKKRLYALAPAAAHLPPPPVDQDEENEDEAMARYTDTNLNSVLFVPTCLPADVAAMEQDDERAAVLVDMNECRVSRTVLASLSSFAVDWVEDIVAYIRQKRLENGNPVLAVKEDGWLVQPISFREVPEAVEHVTNSYRMQLNVPTITDEQGQQRALNSDDIVANPLLYRPPVEIVPRANGASASDGFGDVCAWLDRAKDTPLQQSFQQMNDVVSKKLTTDEQQQLKSLINEQENQRRELQKQQTSNQK